jgi:glycosyltransferase A (GT-A) superfamily protein (DUF2064 family)
MISATRRWEGRLLTRLLVMAKVPVPGTTKIRLRLPAEKSAGLQATLIRSTVEKTCLFGSVTVAGTRPRV